MLTMSDAPVSNDRASLQHGLAQILRCYATAGVKRFNRSTQVQLPANWLQQLAADRSSPEPAAASPTPTLQRAAQAESPIASQAPASAPVPSDVAPVQLALDQNIAAIPPAALQWQLPNLDDDVRLAKLGELNEQVKACRKCQELVCYRRQTVFGEGQIRPKVCFFGEAPGADEDAQGRPFVGAAGRLLTDIINAMRMTREEVYILNSLKCRPPQNRTPLPEEIDNCRPYALTQLEILQPEFIILLGAVAVKSVLQTGDPVGRLRGRFHHFHGARVVVTYHPAYLLRTPEAKKLVWSDVQMVMRELKLI